MVCAQDFLLLFRIIRRLWVLELKFIVSTLNAPVISSNDTPWYHYSHINNVHILTILFVFRYKHATFCERMWLSDEDQELIDLFNTTFEVIAKRFSKDSKHKVYCYNRTIY